MREISGKEILDLVIEADDVGLARGEHPRQRPTLNAQRVMKKLGIEGYVVAGKGTHPIVTCVHETMGKLYRPKDLQIGGVHLGIFMFRDVFARVSVPIMYGSVNINPVDHIDLSELQIRWLANDPPSLGAFYDQFADIYDFGLGLDELGHTKPVGDFGKNLFRGAHFHLQAASAILNRPGIAGGPNS